MASFKDHFDLNLPPIVENDTNKMGNNYCIGYQEMNELAAAKGTNKNSSHLAIGVDDPNTNYKSEYENKTTFNKRYSHNKLKEVDTMPIGSNYNPDNDLIELRTFEHKNNKTYILKPRWGMGSLSIFEAENKKELEVLYEKAKRSIQKSYLRFESNADMNRAILIQEKIKGDEFGLDIFNDFKGENLSVTVKRKYAMRSGETDIAEVTKNSELKAVGKKIANSLFHIGNLDMDILLSDGKAYIIDMNARFGGGYPFTHNAGVNELEAIIRLCSGMELNDLSVKKYGCFAKEITMVELK